MEVVDARARSIIVILITFFSTAVVRFTFYGHLMGPDSLRQ
uniref:Uncharacterized protein n=1 Tax=Arundo donax TaxID=35708 RepID=A0A0A9EXX4_ARUDO